MCGGAKDNFSGFLVKESLTRKIMLRNNFTDFTIKLSSDSTFSIPTPLLKDEISI